MNVSDLMQTGANERNETVPSRIALLAVADVSVLLGLRPPWARLAADLRHVEPWVARVGADQAIASLAGAVLWLTALWLAFALLLVVTSTLPGQLGRAVAAVGALAVPASMRRLLLGTASVAIVVAPAVAATPAFAAPAPPSPSAATAPAVVWPTDPSREAAEPARSAPTAPAHSVTNRAPQAPQAHSTVTVAPGDNLWSIAARSLGPHPTAEQIASAWPRWHEANRSVIGDDPNLIVPGQRLSGPTEPPPDRPQTDGSGLAP